MLRRSLADGTLLGSLTKHSGVCGAMGDCMGWWMADGLDSPGDSAPSKLGYFYGGGSRSLRRGDSLKVVTLGSRIPSLILSHAPHLDPFF